MRLQRKPGGSGGDEERGERRINAWGAQLGFILGPQVSTCGIRSVFRSGALAAAMDLLWWITFSLMGVGFFLFASYARAFPEVDLSIPELSLERSLNAPSCVSISTLSGELLAAGLYFMIRRAAVAC